MKWKKLRQLEKIKSPKKEIKPIKPKMEICKSCGHNVVTTIEKVHYQAVDEFGNERYDNKGNAIMTNQQAIDCIHEGNSYVCLVGNCLCMNPIGKKKVEIGESYNNSSALTVSMRFQNKTSRSRETW